MLQIARGWETRTVARDCGQWRKVVHKETESCSHPNEKRATLTLATLPKY